MTSFAPWDGRRVPVTLLGGYLGAGKTTVLNEMLALTDRPIAVLVNDVGAVNVDAALVARRHGDTIELTDGCICCSLSRGLVDAFDELRQRPEPPDHVVIELSGIADPARVAPWAASLGFRLDGIMVLVDADQFLERVADPIVGTTVATQIDAADLFIVTKTDLVDGDRLGAVRTWLTERSPGTPILDSSGPGATAAFLRTGTRQPKSFAAVPDSGLFDVHDVTTRSLPSPVGLSELGAILDELPADTLRAKAVVNVDEGDLHLVQIVGNRRLITPLPRAEDQATTDLVIIRPRGTGTA